MKNNIKFMHDFYKNDRFIIKYFLRYFIRKNNFNKAKDKMPNFVIINNDYVSMDILIDGYYELKELKVLFSKLYLSITPGRICD